MRTADERTAEIQALEAAKFNIRRYSVVGDDNWTSVNAQIRVIKSQLSEDRIYDAWEDEDMVLDNALDAFRWLKGEMEEAPSVGWLELAGGE